MVQNIHVPKNKTNECLLYCKARVVTLLPGQKEAYYIALRYENDEQICAVRGPIIVTPTSDAMAISILTGNNTNSNNTPSSSRRGGANNNEEVSTNERTHRIL